MRQLILFYLIVISTLPVAAQSVFKDSIVLEAKVWSRDSARKIQYSNWKNFTTHTVDMLNGFSAGKEDRVGKYGGDASVKLKATGFFRTEKVNARWTVVDPDGHPFIVAAINGIRQGKSPNNEKAFAEQFGSVQKWMTVTVAKIQQAGFNTAGSWSDVDAIIQYNKTAKQPLAYTTQLNLLLGYSKQATDLDPARKKASILSFILDSAFVDYCDVQAKKLLQGKDDPNRLGHFSDNEIAFMYTEFKDILSPGNKTEKSYLAAQQWMKAKAVDEKTISREQKEQFIGWLAGIYFKTVSSAIKKYDPNHLYIGSRLHSSAKNNPYLFAAADPYIDIISINYYGYWQPQEHHIAEWAKWSNKPFFITEYYTKAEDAGMTNMSGAGWMVRSQPARGIHYQNFCLQLLQAKNCVGWHWFRYQDNDPADKTADPSNSDSNKGIVNTKYEVYSELVAKMKQLNVVKYQLVKFFESTIK